MMARPKTKYCPFRHTRRHSGFSDVISVYLCSSVDKLILEKVTQVFGLKLFLHSTLRPLLTARTMSY
jgi:hypothetical protein